jgi:hypothetical protein
MKNYVSGEHLKNYGRKNKSTMTPEAREKLKEIVRELLKYSPIPETFSDFLDISTVEKNQTNWTVRIWGEKGGAMTAEGNTEYEAKENAWCWLSSIINECKK